MMLAVVGLILALGTFAHGSTSLEVEVDFQFDPCLLKECAADEECRVVDHAELLEIPVAACVKTNTRPTEAGQCKTLSIGTNILNCKTTSEWIAVGQSQCSMDREDRFELQKRSLKTKYVCHHKTDDQYKYLSAEFECCRKETPSVLTADTPDTTTPSGRPKEDGWTGLSQTDSENDHQTEESGVNGPLNYDRKTGTDEEDYGIVSEDGPGGDHFDKDQPEVNSDEKPQYEPGVEDGDKDIPNSDLDIEVDYGIVSEDGPGDHFDKDQPEVNSDEKPQYEPGVEDGDSDLDSEEEEKDADGSVVIYLVAFVLVCCAVILFGIMAYSRFLASKKHQKTSSPPTVLVNPHCDDYKIVYEVPTYPENQQSSLLKNIYY